MCVVSSITQLLRLVWLPPSPRETDGVHCCCFAAAIPHSPTGRCWLKHTMNPQRPDKHRQPHAPPKECRQGKPALHACSEHQHSHCCLQVRCSSANNLLMVTMPTREALMRLSTQAHQGSHCCMSVLVCSCSTCCRSREMTEGGPAGSHTPPSASVTCCTGCRPFTLHVSCVHTYIHAYTHRRAATNGGSGCRKKTAEEPVGSGRRVLKSS